ncbi:MAG: MetS family NSS transporter small subunit [Gemmatimonadetes bacterium]|uniref:MetS family NSS transporter small subunit n=1 Tax=Candidatus Kutchimonas denitrificans TaxID=3056748 RepID=A0AAE4ZC22_9BACT|nr:MetS family NSS transporter small subunit [Candidatus Kutchimonas denitrificans]
MTGPPGQLGRRYIGKGVLDMNSSAVIVMILTCGFVWGGFVFLLRYGIRREREKQGIDAAG